MAKGRTGPAPGPPAGPVKTFKYGMPLYGLAWPEGPTFYACGGGGSVSSGIKNRLVCAEAHSGSLTDQTAEFLFGLDCPTRLVISPGCKSIVFAMGKGGIQRLDVDTRNKVPRFTEITGSLAEKLKAITMDVKALAFHPSGDLLALGGEDGSVLVLEWPSLKTKVDLSGPNKLAEPIKDLDFAPYVSGGSGGAGGGAHTTGRALAVVLDNGTAAVYDVDKAGSLLCKVALSKGELKHDKVMLISSTDRLLLAHLPSGMENAQFTKVKCKAPSSSSGGSGSSDCPLLTFLMNNRNGCHVAQWELGLDGLLALRAACKVAEAPGACMDVSADGALVTVGTSEGDVALLACRPYLRVVKRFPKAHMIFTTNITFNADASYVLSASADASAAVHSTALPPPPDFKRFLLVAFFVFVIIMMCLGQAVKVLRQQGMSMEEIYGLVGLRHSAQQEL